MAKYKIIWDDVIVEDDLSIENEVFKANGFSNYEIQRCSNKNTQSFVEHVKDADAICCYLPLGKKELEQMKKCQVIAAPALGVDPFDLKAAAELGICVCNAPSYCIDEVATHTIALVMDCVRRISRMDRHVRTGKWDWSERGIQHRMKGQTYGLVSFGNIPQKIVHMMKGFELNFITYDPFINEEDLSKANVKKCGTLKELFEQSDIISVHTPLNNQTRHMIGIEELTNIKQGALFVVTGRGGVVDEVALRQVIEEGRIPAAAMDVIEDEVTFNSILFDMPEVVITPHYAYYSEESTIELRETNALQILDVLKDGKLPRNLVNKGVVRNTNLK
ncbi:MAG: C-terminal binding protein [Lentihominibacter sp.]|jgi:D-3-phosphoglycerate dehydrogenase